MASCGPQSLEDYREEGQGIVRSLIVTLGDIYTREQLIKTAPKLKKMFNSLVGVIIEAREFRDRHHVAEMPEFSKEDLITSDELREELMRIYEIEGGREIIEKCQEEALNRLDAFEKQRTKGT